jgi:hypothetical protein
MYVAKANIEFEKCYAIKLTNATVVEDAIIYSNTLFIIAW